MVLKNVLVVKMLLVLLICGVLTATVTLKTTIILTMITLLVNYKYPIVLTGMNFLTELTVSVIMVWKENTTVLKTTNISAKQ
jgi:hypothetical protein